MRTNQTEGIFPSGPGTDDAFSMAKTNPCQTKSLGTISTLRFTSSPICSGSPFSAAWERQWGCLAHKQVPRRGPHCAAEKPREVPSAAGYSVFIQAMPAEPPAGASGRCPPLAPALQRRPCQPAAQPLLRRGPSTPALRGFQAAASGVSVCDHIPAAVLGCCMSLLWSWASPKWVLSAW